MILKGLGRNRRIAKQAVRSLQEAVSSAQEADDTLYRALALVDGLQRQLEDP